MKKFIFIAVLTVSGLVFVSCSADSAEFVGSSFKQKEALLKLKNGVYLRVGDATTTAPIVIVGPGDDPIRTPPPPKP